MTFEATIQKITPQQAEEWLLNNNSMNRVLKPNHVDVIARDIRAGNWKFNGDAIRFDDEGMLIDGQHRLSAILKSGLSVDTLIIRGIPQEARLTIDSGIRRTAGDQMSILGVKSANGVAAACRYAMILKNGRSASLQYSSSEILDFYNKHTEISEHVSKTKGQVGVSSLAGAASYILSKVRPDLVQGFQDTWTYGVGVRGDAFLSLREKLIQANTSKLRMSTNVKIMLFGYALSKAVNNEKVLLMRLPNAIHIKGWTD